VLFLLAALFVMGGFYSAFAPVSRSAADTGTSQQVAEGKALFAVGCASCHGLNGEGQGGDAGEGLGPSLVGVGAASVDFQVESGRMPMARPAQQAPQKEAQYTDAEVAALAAYVASLGPGPEVPDKADYDPAGLSEEDLAKGGELFRANCSACHNFAGAGGALPNGKYAPSLYGVSNEHVYEAMLTGPQQMPVFSDQVLTVDDKRAIIGYLNELHEQPEQGGHPLGGIGPVSEGLATFVVGLGSLIAFSVWVAAKGARTR
jgi:ubiquinol-cytochrome c reductase cytochrome c subunit